MLRALAFTRRLAPTRLPASSLMPVSRYIVTVSGDTEESKKKDAKREYDRLYQEKNKEAISQYQKVYREENRDAINQKAKIYYEQKQKQDRHLQRQKGIDSKRHSIALHPIHSQHLLSKEERDAIYNHLLHEKKWGNLEGLTLAKAIASGKWTFYFSASKVPGIEEKLVCLTTRRISHRPVLLMTDGTRIRKNFAKSQLGAVGMVLHRSRLVFNELQLLWRLQETYHHLPLGYRRLNRHVGQPNYRAAEEIDDDKTVCSLYFNCFPVTSQDTPEINGIPLMLHPSIDP
mmetsp:Transcript_28117/g.63697  ORF Transcript_28117/g.63697 Transcript_28117/m.63697 type:complete len:288 (-) Transcript_28117:111-974(-)